MMLSACMIVKNEQDLLPQCLKSIKDICDEIIIVDTGSTDDTVEIAKEFGAKVYFHEWQNNFSLHRNQAFDYASGNWMLVIDADEELIIPDPKEFKDRLKRINEAVKSLQLTVVELHEGQIRGSWLGPRFFRKDANPRYSGIVHNKIHCEGISAGTDIILRHYGYHLDPDKMMVKNLRTRALLEKRLESDPEDYWAEFYMAQQSAVDGDYKSVIEWASRCLDHVPLTEEDDLTCFGVIYFWLGMSYLRIGDGIKAYPCLLKGLEFYPDDIDLNFAMAYYGHLTMQNDLVYEHGKKYLDEVKKQRADVTVRIGKSATMDMRFMSFINGANVANRSTYSVTDDHIDKVNRWMNESGTSN